MPKKALWLPYEEAKVIARGLGLKNKKAWEDYAASARRPSNMPSTPDKLRTYKDKWVGWPDWLGTE